MKATSRYWVVGFLGSCLFGWLALHGHDSSANPGQTKRSVSIAIPAGKTTPTGKTASATAGKAPKPLRIGDKMPPIGDQVQWLQGKSVPKFQKGKIYVIDLWATWCGPCIQGIPEMADLSKKLAKHNVIVIGLALDPRGSVTTAEFLKQTKVPVPYIVCEERKPSFFGRELMRRTGRKGIPSVLIVNRKGILAWMGRPEDMYEPLYEITLDIYDLANAKKTGGVRKPRDAMATPTQLSKGTKRNAAAALAKLDRLLLVRRGKGAMGIQRTKEKLDPKVRWQVKKAQTFIKAGKEEQAQQMVNTLAQTKGNARPQGLIAAAELSLELAEKQKQAENYRRAVDLALKACQASEKSLWPAAGVLVLVLDVIEDRLNKGEKSLSAKANRPYFESVLKQHGVLRQTQPPESIRTFQLRKALLPQ